MQDLLGSIGAKLAESGIVVVIGVGLVFLILALLIGVVQMLRQINFVLETWDDRMVYIRARKSEIKKIKKANAEHYEALKAELNDAKHDGTMTKQEFSAAIEKMKNDKMISKEDFLKSKNIIKMKYATVFNIRKERKFAIKKATRLSKKAFDEANATCKDKNAYKNAKMLAKLALAKEVATIKEDFAAKIKAASEGKAVAAHKEFTGAPAENVEVNNNALVAAITAAVAMMLECEAQEKKVNFRVRNIREVK